MTRPAPDSKAAPASLGQALTALQRRGLDRLDAQLLLLHVLQRPATQRGWLLAHDTDTLPGACTAPLEQLVRRRLAGEPLAYLTGVKAFHGLELQVSPAVLVPRPDTETLVDWALEALEALEGLAPAAKVCHLLDLGTGSGAVALAIRSRRPELSVWATDDSSAALAVAQANARRLGLAVHFLHGHWLQALPADAPRFAMVVSNPPYIAESDPHLAQLQHEPTQALTSGPDGLDDIRQIIRQAPDHMLPGAWLLLEHGHQQAPAVRELLALAGLQAIQSRRDLAGIERCSGARLPP